MLNFIMKTNLLTIVLAILTILVAFSKYIMNIKSILNNSVIYALPCLLAGCVASKRYSQFSQEEVYYPVHYEMAAKAGVPVEDMFDFSPEIKRINVVIYRLAPYIYQIEDGYALEVSNKQLRKIGVTKAEAERVSKQINEFNLQYKEMKQQGLAKPLPPIEMLFPVQSSK